MRILAFALQAVNMDMYKLFLIVLAITIFSFSNSFASSSNNKIPCWVSGDAPDVITSQLSILKSYLLPINLDDPEGDAKKRIHNKDYRLLGIGGLGVEFPSVDSSEKEILCTLGWRYIQGTSDVHESKEHIELIKKFKKYSEIYNKKILSFWKEKDEANN